MSESEHSDGEFNYTDEPEIVTTGGGDDETKNNNSQEEIENFLKEQKNANTARKTTCDLKTLKRKMPYNKQRTNLDLSIIPGNIKLRLILKAMKRKFEVNDSQINIERALEVLLVDFLYLPSNWYNSNSGYFSLA